MRSEEPGDVGDSVLPEDAAAGEPAAGTERAASDGAASGIDASAPDDDARPVDAASGDPSSDAEAEISPELAAAVAAMNAELDAGVAAAKAEAQAWAAQVRRVTALQAAARAAEAAGMPQFLHLDIAGSWRVSQHTATRLMNEADRFTEALPLSLSLLETGELWRPQAYVLLHRTANCTAEIARAVEAEVLPAGAQLCPADLSKLVTRTVLRIESEQTDAAATEQTPGRRRRRAADLHPRRRRRDGFRRGGADRSADCGVEVRTGRARAARADR
jgi:hypothetical protein